MTQPAREDSSASPGTCPFDVQRAIMSHSWNNLTFLHWRYDADVVQRLLPPGLTVETADGTAWVGLVPFVMRVSLPRSPTPPWLGRFPETNIRTYVRDASGRSGVWFFSLDAARLAAVVAARATYRLPYFWSTMTAERSGDRLRYASTRRWPGPVGASLSLEIDVGPPLDPAGLSPLDHFLTARWRLFSVPWRGRLRHAHAVHPPWVLRAASVVSLDESLIRAAGLPSPDGAPRVHYSDGVDVRISRSWLAG